MLMIEMLKCYKIYPSMLYKIVWGSSKQEIWEMIEQDFFGLCLILPVIFLVFSFLFKRNLATVNEFEKIKEQLQKSNSELKAALEERESFILSFSHEVRNPLNSVLGNVELAYEEARDLKIKEKLKNSKLCGDMLLSLINNMLDVAKAGMGKLEVHPKDCDFIPIFKKVWTVCREIIRSRKLQPVLELQGEFPEKVMLDQYRLMQILFNLIGNAVKFTEQGEVRMKISWIRVNSQGMREDFIGSQEEIEELPKEPFYENKRLKNLINQENLQRFSSFESLPPISDEGVTFSQKKSSMNCSKQCRTNLSDIDKGNLFPHNSVLEEYAELDEFAHVQTFESNQPGVLRIDISDTGIGISKEDQKKLFRKFSQFSKNSEKSKVGTGLGLWITREICEKMGGTIQVFSEVGHGTTFRVELNCDSCHSPKQSFETCRTNLIPKQLELLTPSLRAMIVEDDFFNADVLDMFFQRFNIEVVKKVKNGVDALKCYEEGITNDKLINIVTLDLNMPLMDGKTACKEIRELEKCLNLPPAIIIIISGSNLKIEPEMSEKYSDYKPDYFLTKPVKKRDFDDMLIKVIKQLSMKKLKTFTKRKALLFNDGEFGLKFMAEMLSYRNVQSILVDEIEDAFDKYKKEWKEIGLVLMDYDTNGEECIELSKRIQFFCKVNKTRLPSIYYLANKKSSSFVERCKQAGIFKVLLKPIHFQTLIRKIAPEPSIH